MKNIINRLFCICGLHDWDMVGEIKPIVSNDVFDTSLKDMMALGRCRKCGKKALRVVFGRFSFHSSEKITKKEYMKEYGNE